MKRNRRPRPPDQAPSAFAGFPFPPDVILLAVRWYLRYALSYRVRSLIQERRFAVDHVTFFQWVQRLTAELIDAAGVCRHLYRAVDQHGQVITDRAPGASMGSHARGRHLLGLSRPDLLAI